MRAMNSANALTAVIASGSNTATQIAEMIGVSRTAIEAILTDLINTGWLHKAPLDGLGQLGRPAAQYDLSPGAGRVAAIDFDSHSTGVAVADLRGRILLTLREGIDAQFPRAERIETSLTLLRQALRRAKVRLADLLCVGIASPGVTDQGKVLLYGGGGLPGWTGHDLRADIATTLKVPSVLEGDSALGALAERRLGAGRDCHNFVYIYSGRRTGAAIISHGQILRGAHGAVGLIGELPEIRWRELETAYDDLSNDFVPILGLGIADMVLAVDPEVVIIGGSRRDLIEPRLNDLQTLVANRCPITPQLTLGHFGGDAVLRGSVCLAVDAVSAAVNLAISEGHPLPAPDALGPFIGPGI
jgi:predicted NBD/HSP70 family sugar kinase